jgi:parvulin-like peptidyl-prolyl isomerase
MKTKACLEQPSDECCKRAIDCLIDAALLQQEALAAEVKVSEDELEENVIDFMLNHSDENDFNETMSKFKITHDCIRKRLKAKLLIQHYIQEHFKANVSFTEDDLRDFYDEHIEQFKTKEMVRVSHILIKGDNEKSKVKADEVFSKINSPEDFHHHAETCSNCPSGCNSGDLGFIQRGKMIQELDDIIFELEIDEISKPIRTPFGYHIVLVTDKKESKVAKFDQIKETLGGRLKEIESELLLLEHLNNLRDNACIEIMTDKLMN